MSVQPESPNKVSPAKVVFHTWWPVAAAILVGVVMHPGAAIVVALALAVARRYDRPVMLTLIGVAVFWLLFLTLFMGINGGVGSSG